MTHFPLFLSRIWFVLLAFFIAASAATLVFPRWLEFLFKVDPDGGSGASERVIVISAGVILVASLMAAMHTGRIIIRARRA
jgi:hypothetical protein